MIQIESHHRDWLDAELALLTSDIETFTPSQWAEQKRYLPSSVTSLPGKFSFDVCPYMREPLDCLSVDSPIRELTFMKGAQVCATTAILENAIGYFIEHVKTAPMMLATADEQLAKLRLEAYILPMLQSSGLDDLVKSSDERNPRKTGRTAKRLDWEGGGFLLPYGAKSPNKFRQTSVRILLNDEVDGWADVIGKDGDPLQLVASRTKGYESSRKIVNVSTPLLEGSSKIKARFLDGDQRYYHVCCLKCGFPQVLTWKHTDQETGVVSGMTWDVIDGRVDYKSIRYLCQNPGCTHPHTNDDKTKLLSPEYGAEWLPTATAKSPDHRSYHISALYSPVGMQTWEACLKDWLAAWDEENGRPLDKGRLQVFYNNILGKTFKVYGDSVHMQDVSPHRRSFYRFGEIPNKFCAEFCGSPVVLVTAAVDVHKDNLAVAVFGWTRGRRAFLIDYWRFTGNAEQLDDAGTWGRLRDLLDNKEYEADDGRKYRVQLTAIDCGYRTDEVYQFAAEYGGVGICPVKGREYPVKGSVAREFSEFRTPMGTHAYSITVDFYKDRWASALRRQWDGQSHQPAGMFNAPADVTDAQLKELTAEIKKELQDKATGQHVGYKWHRKSGAANELWDLIVYNNAALDLVARDVCVNSLGLDAVDWDEFYRVCIEEEPFLEH